MKNFYITTAIDYANGRPHLGHTYEKVLADVIARVHRLKGESVHFLTGLDEHGQKVQQSALSQGIEPQKWCDGIASTFQELCQKLGISNDDYIRTTESRHKAVVCNILQDFYNRGDIYKAEYKGFYSLREEQFLQEKDRDADGRWPERYGEVKEIVESNYFFKLSRHQEWLIQYIQQNEHFIFPTYRRRQVLEFLKEPINDLCISRPKERLSWGIPLPFDANYVTYVWFDALINYISAVKFGEPSFTEYWPADYHVIGKDILAPAHAVYWPIMLHAAGIPLPKTLLVHGWWTVSGSKMSKSVGNVVDPLEWCDRFGTDAMRYFLVREMNVGQDSDFSEDLFLARYNSDLANDLGNLVSRLLNMASRYCGGIIPGAEIREDYEKSLQERWLRTVEETQRLYDTLQFHTGLECLFTFIKSINRYAEQRAPWKLASSQAPDDRKRLETALATIAEAIRLATALLTPIMPSCCEQVQGALGQERVQLWGSTLQWSDRCGGKKVSERMILFPRFMPQNSK